jgi:DNA-binding response OmpR family regulator
MNPLIAVVDDEPDILNLVTLHLKKAGYEVAGFLNGDQFYTFLENKIPDLLILDLMLPDIDGFEICKQLKKNVEWENIPIIMLTAKEDETDKVLGLELGADDYVTKPFSPRELVARVKAVLRRRAIEPKTTLVEIGDLITIDSDKHEVKLMGKKIELTSTEFKILYFLASKPGWVFSRDKILDYLWGQEKAVVDRTIDVHVRHLREKLGEYGDIIKNVRGIGYKLEK